MNNQTTNPVFHGSDIEKISACYHIKKKLSSTLPEM